MKLKQRPEDFRVEEFPAVTPAPPGSPGGAFCFYRLEKRGWIRGRWVEKAGQRRRRYYRLTAAGAKILKAQREGWVEFVEAISRITGIQHA